MFSYYGSKSKVVDLYPSPKFGKIIEPFAGSARYSLKYFDRDILLVDKYQIIVDVWHYLQQASEADILKLPRLKEGDKITDYKFSCDGERYLMGFLINGAVASPRITASKRVTTNRPKFQDYQIKSIASQLFKIRHWKIVCADYQSIENAEATWFIDPPYQVGGREYKVSNKNINYSSLADWCISRSGQVIVCENENANWMSFSPMKNNHGSIRDLTEMIWTNYRHDFQAVQSSLF